jgi:hypothetical protein
MTTVRERPAPEPVRLSREAFDAAVVDPGALFAAADATADAGGADIDPGAVAFLEAARAASVTLEWLPAPLPGGQTFASLPEKIRALVESRAPVVSGRDGDPADGAPGLSAPARSARRIQVDPGRAVLVASTAAGVEAARRGGFGCVVGVAPRARGPHLRIAGAHLVVRSLGGVAVSSTEPSLRPLNRLPSAFQAMERLAGALRDGTAVVFLDFDGTLAPIVGRFEQARLPDGTRDALVRLAALARSPSSAAAI